EPGTFSFPEIDAVKRGEGVIRLHFAASLPRLSAGLHQLSFRNRYQRSRSVYLANALVPQSRLITVTAQRRDVDQTELTIDYVKLTCDGLALVKQTRTEHARLWRGLGRLLASRKA